MEVSFEIDKIIKCAIYSTVFFPSGGGVDEWLMRLSLIKKIIKDVNSMCISCSFKRRTDILEIVNEFVQYVQYDFQYLYIPI